MPHSTVQQTISVNHDNDLLVITCASGKQASALIPNVVNRWKRLRLVCHSPTSEEKLKKAYPKAEVTRANLSSQDECRRILKDATVIYHVEPPFVPRQAALGFNMVDAAKHAAQEGIFKHFVYASVLNPQLSKMLHHHARLQVEEYVMESGLNYTILQPTHFMFLFPMGPILAQQHPVYTANWNPDVAFSFIALQDLGEVSAKILNERESHYLAEYPLCGDGPLNYRQVCEIASKKIGKTIELRQRTFEESVHGFCTRMFGTVDADAESVDGTERLLLYYNRHGLIGSSNICRWLLGRKSMSWEDWMTAEIDKIQQERK